MALRKTYQKVLEDYTIDILSIMRDQSSVSHDIAQKILELTTQLVSPRNLKEVMLFLEKEILRACKMDDKGSNSATSNSYRYLLIKSVSQIT